MANTEVLWQTQGGSVASTKRFCGKHKEILWQAARGSVTNTKKFCGKHKEVLLQTQRGSVLRFHSFLSCSTDSQEKLGFPNNSVKVWVCTLC